MYFNVFFTSIIVLLSFFFDGFFSIHDDDDDDNGHSKQHSMMFGDDGGGSGCCCWCYYRLLLPIGHWKLTFFFLISLSLSRDIIIRKIKTFCFSYTFIHSLIRSFVHFSFIRMKIGVFFFSLLCCVKATSVETYRKFIKTHIYRHIVKWGEAVIWFKTKRKNFEKLLFSRHHHHHHHYTYLHLIHKKNFTRNEKWNHMSS